MHPKITIGILSYHDKKYLELTLPLLTNLDYENYQIIICDNTLDSKTAIWINQNFPSIKTISPKQNLGFSKGHNLLIKEAILNQSEYYLCFNSDIYPSSNYLTELQKGFQPNKKTAAVSPLIYKWTNFPNKPNKSSLSIDSAGIKTNIFQKFSEIEQIPSQTTEIWGASGASPLFKISALQDIQLSEGEFFDEDYFMYKEDIDLSYRFRWAGYKAYTNPTAISWHDRTGSQPKLHKEIQIRKTRQAYVKENSFLNHLQLIYKNWDPNFSLKLKLGTTISISAYITYLVLFDRKTLKQIKEFKKRKTNLKAKRTKIKKRISPKQMEKTFKIKI